MDSAEAIRLLEEAGSDQQNVCYGCADNRTTALGHRGSGRVNDAGACPYGFGGVWDCALPAGHEGEHNGGYTAVDR